MASLPLLSANEARVLGVMIEKQRTVPDTYPLSLNALTAGCNQKNSRDPVLNLTEAEVAEGLLGLRSHSLVIETTGSRVSRYGHNLERVLGIPTQSAALLAILMLRGPQTVGELRINCERLHRFADISAVEGFLNEMAERADGKLVVELPRQPGARENRWAHLLCGEVDIAALQEEAAPASRINSQTEARFAALEAEVARLREMVEKLSAALGG